jgi:hypothetical protein
MTLQIVDGLNGLLVLPRLDEFISSLLALHTRLTLTVIRLASQLILRWRACESGFLSGLSTVHCRKACCCHSSHLGVPGLRKL